MTALLMLSKVGRGCIVGIAPMCSLTLSNVKLMFVVVVAPNVFVMLESGESCWSLDLCANALSLLWDYCLTVFFRLTRTVEQS